MISLQTWPAVVRQRSIPMEIRSLDTFATPDYADMFTATATTTPDISPAQWARAVFKSGPLRVRLVLHRRVARFLVRHAATATLR